MGRVFHVIWKTSWHSGKFTMIMTSIMPKAWCNLSALVSKQRVEAAFPSLTLTESSDMQGTALYSLQKPTADEFRYDLPYV